MAVRVLLLADSHLGFDLPARPRVPRRRRGPDFLDNHRRALRAAVTEGVDLVVHGGDVFHKPGALPSLAYQAYEPLRAVADAGIPVAVVPGNHERGRLPHLRFLRHPLIHVFDEPRTVTVDAGGVRVALAGFPYTRRIRDAFGDTVHGTGWGAEAATAHAALLCMHHCFEGATVGPADYTFRRNRDVVQAADVPRGFAAVLSGHIHRHQVLTRDLRGRLLPCPVFYPGSVERTAFAEAGEAKGYLVLEVEPGPAGSAGRASSWTFHRLPSRPMVQADVAAAGRSGDALAAEVRRVVAAAPPEAVVRVRLRGTPAPSALRALTASRIRALTPVGMNLEVVWERPEAARRPSRAEPVRQRDARAAAVANRFAGF